MTDIQTARKLIHLDCFGETMEAVLHVTRYRNNGRLAVQLVSPDSEDDEVATLSVNLVEEPMADDEFAFKTYSENEGLFEQVIAHGVIRDTGRRTRTGLPICRLA
jgi:hypothetical protein